LALAAIAIVAAVAFRSWFFLQYDESYFDSDQAIVGLMAKHLAEGRAKPLFFYGQEYMLAVEAWVMAPVFALLGPTVFALRLTLILLNVAGALVLWWLLMREVTLPPWMAALAAAPFAMAPFVTAAHLVEAQGGNVEPFLWVLVIWLLRARAVPLGIALGLAFLNREFTIYAVPALLTIQLAQARGRFLPLVRPWLLTLASFVLVLVTITALKPYADLLGPGSAGIRPDTAVTSNVSQLLGRIRIEPAALPFRFRAMLEEHLPQLFGVFGFRPSLINVGLFVHVGWPELLPLLALLAAALLLWLAVDVARHRSFAGTAFPIYLGLIAIQSALVYPLTRNPTMFTFRYGLLALLLPVSLGALSLQASRPVGLRAIGAMVLALLASAACLDHLTVIRSTGLEPPPPRLAPLVAHLEARGYTVARAGYWRAYALSFLAQERVRVASTDMQRIREYQLSADQAGPAALLIDPEPCKGREEVEVFEGWHFCK
jgi:hypothetical protein